MGDTRIVIHRPLLNLFRWRVSVDGSRLISIDPTVLSAAQAKPGPNAEHGARLVSRIPIDNFVARRGIGSKKELKN